MAALGLGVQHCAGTNGKSHAKRRSKLARPEGCMHVLWWLAACLLLCSNSFFPLNDLLLEPRSQGYS